MLTRTLAFASLLQSAGAVLFLMMFGAWLRHAAVPIRRLGQRTAMAAIALIALHQSLDAARMAADLSGIADAGLERLAWQGASGLAAVLQMAGMSLIAWRLRAAGPQLSAMAVTGAIVAVVAEILTGHTSVHHSRALLTPLLALHLLLIAFWFGALLPLIVCCRHESREMAVAVLRGFSAVAGYLVPCLGLAGLVMAQTLMPHRADWQSTYARFILTKLGAFAVLLLLAAWNRWRAVPAAAATPSPLALSGLQRIIAVEYALILGVMAVTATMTALYSP